jgi:hypothetical protein
VIFGNAAKMGSCQPWRIAIKMLKNFNFLSGPLDLCLR